MRRLATAISCQGFGRSLDPILRGRRIVLDRLANRNSREVRHVNALAGLPTETAWDRFGLGMAIAKIPTLRPKRASLAMPLRENATARKDPIAAYGNGGRLKT